MIDRGEVWWADLGGPRGSAPTRRRPVVIIQHDSFNASRLRTVVVAAMTSNLRLAAMPGNVLVPAATTGLPQDSVVNVTQMATLDRSDLLERVGALDPWLIGVVDDGIRRVLDL